MRTIGASTHHTMQARIVIGTAFFAVSKGISMAQITQRTGLDATQLVDHEGRLPDHIVGEIWQLIDASSPGQALSLDMATIAPSDFFGPLGYAMRHAGSLREGLSLFVRYQTLLSDRLEITLEEGPVLTSLNIAHPADRIDSGYAAEVGLALGALFIRRDLKLTDTLARVTLAYSGHGPNPVYREFFEVPVDFEQQRNSLLLRTEHLDRALETGGHEIFKALNSHLQTVHHQLEPQDEHSDLLRLQRAIYDNARQTKYSVKDLAHTLGSSVRSLQRTAKRHGTTLHQMIERARHGHAQKLLGDTTLTVEEVAFLLGFSDIRSFSRAFKRTSGTTPAAYRRGLS